MISQEELEKFKAIYKKKSGIDLSDQDALEMATKLFALVKAVYSPMRFLTNSWRRQKENAKKQWVLFNFYCNREAKSRDQAVSWGDNLALFSRSIRGQYKFRGMILLSKNLAVL
jgi:hypothetical protein